MSRFIHGCLMTNNFGEIHNMYIYLVNVRKKFTIWMDLVNTSLIESSQLCISWLLIRASQQNQLKIGMGGEAFFPRGRTGRGPVLKVDAHRPGRPLRINLMSRYICFSQFWGTFFKSSKSWGIFQKKRFLGSIFGVFSCSVAISEPICMKFWLPG